MVLYMEYHRCRAGWNWWAHYNVLLWTSSTSSLTSASHGWSLPSTCRQVFPNCVDRIQFKTIGYADQYKSTYLHQSHKCFRIMPFGLRKSKTEVSPGSTHLFYDYECISYMTNEQAWISGLYTGQGDAILVDGVVLCAIDGVKMKICRWLCNRSCKKLSDVLQWMQIFQKLLTQTWMEELCAP